MAHPVVEKAKTFGIRHGEKVGVALTAALCLVFVVMAFSRETIDLTPEQIANTSEAAQRNLNQPQSDEAIVERLDTEGLIPAELVEQVVLAQQQQNVETKLAFTGPPWVFPEPGTGLIRETPQLVVPLDLYVTAGRGGMRVFETDEKGELVFEEPEEGATPSPMAMAMAGMEAGMTAQPDPKAQEKLKKQQEADRKRLEQSLAGTPRGELAEQIGQNFQQGLLPAETTAGYRWVALVGMIDHQTLRDNYAAALKAPDAQPHYKRLDVQRRQLLDGEENTWSEWYAVDHDYNQSVLAYVTHQDEELAPADVILEGLVDMLPFLQVGSYKNVHYGPLVAAERIAPPPPSMGGMLGMEGGYGSGMDMAAMMEEQMAMMSGAEMMYGGDMMGGMGMYGMGMEADFPKSTAPELMVRSLDFTVEPDTAYQYRVRIVLANPNLGREDTQAGTDVTSEELFGPWSEPTSPVRVPADVTTYALGTSPADPNSVRFQVVSFDETTGLTVVETFDQRPGQVVGRVKPARVPRENGEGTSRSAIDFTSRQILLDAAGGSRPLSTIGGTSTFQSPTLAVVMRPDGTLLLRDQTQDFHDPEMRQLKEVYDQIIKDAEEGGKKPPMDSMMMEYGMFGI